MARPDIPPLSAIRVAEAAARHRNFTAAADELGMTQAAVSYQIKILEERVGTALFERHARGVSLTSVGHVLTSRASEALDILADAYADARGTSDATLVMSIIPTFATNFLAERIGTFQLSEPDIAVRIEIGEALVDLSAGDFDLAIRGGLGKWEGMKAHLLLPTLFSPMLSPALAKSGELSKPADLLNLPILSEDDPWWRQWFDEAGVDHSCHSENTRQPFGSQIIEASAAIAGQGVAMLSPAFFQKQVQRGELVQPFELTCHDGSGYWVVYPESRRNSGKIRKFVRWILNETEMFQSNTS